MKLIASTTVGAGGASSIEFTSINSTYTDLVLYLSVMSSASRPWSYIKFNSVATNYKYVMAIREGGSNYQNYTQTTSGLATTAITLGVTQQANFASNTRIYIPNYTSTTLAKTAQIRFGAPIDTASGYAGMVAGLSTETGALSSITITPSTGTYSQYTSAYLYGIAKGSGGATIS